MNIYWITSCTPAEHFSSEWNGNFYWGGRELIISRLITLVAHKFSGTTYSVGALLFRLCFLLVCSCWSVRTGPGVCYVMRALHPRLTDTLSKSYVNNIKRHWKGLKKRGSSRVLPIKHVIRQINLYCLNLFAQQYIYVYPIFYSTHNSCDGFELYEAWAQSTRVPFQV